MAAVTVYGTLPALRARIGSAGGAWSAVDDELHADALEQASRLVDGFCRRFFGTTASATARTFTAVWSDRLIVPDLVSVSALETDETGDGTVDTTWAAADYHLEPTNAATRSGEAWPFTAIRVSTLSGSAANYFPTTRNGVRVTGVWGWPSIPAPVKRATVLEALRILQQDQAPSGVHASAEVGAFIVTPDLHPTTKRALMPYRRIGGPGAWDGR